MQFLQDMADNNTEDVNIFRVASVFTNSADILVSPTYKEQFEDNLNEEVYDFLIINENIQNAIDAERESMNRQRRVHEEQHHRKRSIDQYPAVKDPKHYAPHHGEFDIGQYNSYSQISSWMAELSRNNSDIVNTLNLGLSAESRVIHGLRLGSQPNTTAQNGIDRKKPAVLIEAGMHSREWISISTAVYVINAFITDYRANDASARYILDKYDVYIIPCLNPDGYEYSRLSETNRFWRKTRSRSNITFCIGVDPNRNWDFHWAEGESSLKRPCSDIYAGPSAFSESEVKALAQFIERLNDSLQIYVSLHAYGQVILGPWAFKHSLPSSFFAQKHAADVGIEAIRQSSNETYVFGSISNMLYKTSGTSIDYIYEKGVPYVYGFELRPTVSHSGYLMAEGFIMPTTQIQPTGDEIYAAFTAMLEHVALVRNL